MTADEGAYAVVWPLAPFPTGATNRGSLPARPVKRLGFIWDYLFSGDLIFEELTPKLNDQFPGVEIIGPEIFGNIHGANEEQVLERLEGGLTATRVDSVIVAVGA